MSVSAVHHSTHYLPVQPTPPVAPVKPKAEHAEHEPQKVKSKPPAGVGEKVDIQA